MTESGDYPVIFHPRDGSQVRVRYDVEPTPEMLDESLATLEVEFGVDREEIGVEKLYEVE